MNTLDIQQATATGETKLQIEAWSAYLKQSHGMRNYCPRLPVGCLVLFLWALGAWDNRPGAVNPYPESQLRCLLAQISNV